MLASFAEMITETLGSTLKDIKMKYGIERPKALSVTMLFEGLTDAVDVEAWLSLIEKCFKVMGCLKERQVRLDSFLLQKEVEN